jgi:hypothetical protein
MGLWRWHHANLKHGQAMMREVTVWPMIAALAGAFAGSPQSTLRIPIDVSMLGPQVGERVPDFNLKDQKGKSWTLPSVMGPKGAMLVFFRSADW